jgi:hypothetical protein
LFVLQQEVALYDAYQQRIVKCDQELEQHLRSFADKVHETDPDGAPSPTAIPEKLSGPKRRRKAGSHAPQFDLGRELRRISGVDLTRIDGIDVGVAQTVIAKLAWNVPLGKRAVLSSSLGLCPDNRITGGKVFRQGIGPVINRAATALRLAATTLLRSQSHLGAQYRRFRSKLGAPKAVMLRCGYTETGARACRLPDLADLARRDCCDLPGGVVAVSDHGTLGGLTHNSLPNSAFRAQPLARKLWILKTRRDVRVVEGARLESDPGKPHRAIPKHRISQSIQELPLTTCSSV